jgi:iron complex transport system ATP-binding protein
MTQLIIEMEKVSVIRDSKYLLKDIDWVVKSGEHWAVLGLNGSGKTTLLHMLNGYIYPSQGTVRVLGNIFGKNDLRELRKYIGWVSTAVQEKFYTRETTHEIVLSGRFGSIGLFDKPEREDVERADYLLDLFDCTHLSKRPYLSLSQGEKQRILIARGLMAAPPLLILDEPCTGLDIIAKEQLLGIISKLSLDKDAPTLIYVTHQTEEIIDAFRHTLLLRRGEVYSQGKTEDLMTDSCLSDFFEEPVEIDWHNKRARIRLLNY